MLIVCRSSCGGSWSRPQRRSQHRRINGNWSGASILAAAERCGMTPFVRWRRGGNSSGMNETTALFHLRQRAGTGIGRPRPRPTCTIRGNHKMKKEKCIDSEQSIDDFKHFWTLPMSLFLHATYQCNHHILANPYPQVRDVIY